MKRIIILICFEISVYQLFAQLNISGELRFRGEYRDGYKMLPHGDLSPAVFLTQRSRLGVFYQSDNYNLGIIVQDSRIWGDESVFNSTGISGDQASLDLKEAWLFLKLSSLCSLRIGRQEWVYDDERLLSRRDWGNMGMQYDGVLFQYHKNDFTVDAGFSWNNKDENLFGEDYRYFQTSYYFDTLSQTIKILQKETVSKIKSLDFVYLRKNLGDKLKLSLLGLFTLHQHPGTADVFHLKYTFGPFISYTPSWLSFKGQFYYQTGKDLYGYPVSACFTGVNTTFKLTKCEITVGADIISGQSPDNSAQKTLFDLMYGNRHRYYGHLDYFSQTDKSTLSGGLNDYFLKTVYKTNDKFEVNFDYHYFMTNKPVKNPLVVPPMSEYLNKFLAHEGDLFFSYKIFKEISLKGGFSVLLPSVSLETIQGIPEGEAKTAKWFWLMLTAKPTLFNEKK